jgi:acyl-CoA dehydrogenase
MDFKIPDEYTMFVETVRRFREQELAPTERQFLLDGKLDLAVRFGLEKNARDQGFWALDVPEEYGGQGMGELAMCLVVEELYKHPAMFGFGGSPDPALYHGTDEQKEKYLLGVIRGEKRGGCVAFTEPNAGSDLAGIRTVAKREGSSWKINGTKTFISEFDRADFVILFAMTDLSAGSRGVTVFLVDKGAPGLTASPIPTMGDDWEPYELSFQDCVIPDNQRLSEVGEGWKVAVEQLTHGRTRIAAYQLGIAQRCLDLAIDWAKERVTWGKHLASRQAIQWMIADSEVELQAARMLVYRAAWMADEGVPIENEAMVAKLYATEMSQRVTDRCLQIFGGLGYSRELPIQSFYRQVRVWRIGHGTTEINRWMIARNLLKLSSKDA